MSKSRLEFKVGLFVTISLVLLGALIMRFSKGAGAFASTYKIGLKTENVGGVIPGVAVLMAGVPIGNVVSTDFTDESGREVMIVAKIKSKYKIHKDAVFSIKQAGLLGDRFISVVPSENKGPLLKDGDEVRCEEPFDLQEVARSTAGLMRRVEQTVQQLSVSVGRLDSTLLSTQTLSNLTTSFANFRILSERAIAAVNNINQFVETNTPTLGIAVTNFSAFSSQLNNVAKELQETVVTNRVEFTAAVKNIGAATAKLDSLLGEINSGTGLAGTVIKDEKLALEVSELASNLNVFSRNLNEKGLLSVLRKPKAEKKKADEKKR